MSLSIEVQSDFSFIVTSSDMVYDARLLADRIDDLFASYQWKVLSIYAVAFGGNCLLFSNFFR